jgi:glycosyltransferase involved in cell wall biosynthesis
MKILFIYMFLSLGGVETVLKNRHEGFQRLGIETDFLFLEDHGGASSFGSMEDAKVYITKNTDEIEKIIERGNYSLISVIDTPSVHDILRKTALSSNISMEVHTPFPPFRKYITDNIVEDAKAVIVPTNMFGKIVDSEMKKPHPPIITIPNPVNSSFFNDKNVATKNHRIPIAMVSRIENIKDWRESVHIMEKVLRKRTDIELFMIGRTIEDKPADIYRECSKRGIMGNLRWIPFIHYSKMPSFYRFIAQNNGVYLSSSKGESFGMTLIESMACRLPIVAYNLPVFREVLEEGEYGRIYHTVDEAADHILSLIEDRKERDDLTERAHRNALRKYTATAFAETWKERIMS